MSLAGRTRNCHPMAPGGSAQRGGPEIRRYAVCETPRRRVPSHFRDSLAGRSPGSHWNRMAVRAQRNAGLIAVTRGDHETSAISESHEAEPGTPRVDGGDVGNSVLISPSRASRRFSRSPGSGFGKDSDRQSLVRPAFRRGIGITPRRTDCAPGRSFCSNQKAASCFQPATCGTRSKVSGGEGGIRTLGELAPTPVFETGTIGHSVTSPGFERLTPVARRRFGGQVRRARIIPPSGRQRQECRPRFREAL